MREAFNTWGSLNLSISVRKIIEIKKNFFNIKSSTLSRIIIQKKNYFSQNRIVKMTKISLFGTFNFNFLKILM